MRHLLSRARESRWRCRNLNGRRGAPFFFFRTIPFFPPTTVSSTPLFLLLFRPPLLFPACFLFLPLRSHSPPSEGSCPFLDGRTTASGIRTRNPRGTHGDQKNCATSYPVRDDIRYREELLVYIRNVKSRRCPGRSPSPGACGLLPAVGDGDRPGVGLCGRGRWAQPAANAPRMRIAQPPGRERKTTAPRASAIRQEEEAPAKRIQRGVDARRARWPGPPAPARREIRLPRRRSHEDRAFP